MKIVILAQTPPPLHGQSFMVGQMIHHLGGDLRRQNGQPNRPSEGIQCFHVNAQLSDDLTDIGSVRIGKIVRLINYTIEAIWCRFYYGADVLYYVPAPPKRSAFYRDCMALGICRPFFSETIFHWHASGLGQWLTNEAFTWERWIGRKLLGKPDLSVSLTRSLEADANYLGSTKTYVVPNGIPDPCPKFEAEVLPSRLERLARRRQAVTNPSTARDDVIYSVLFLGHCTREKGIFDALDAIELANRELKAEMSPIRMRLTIAGAFLNDVERNEFEAWQHSNSSAVIYAGFVDSEGKAKLLRDSDCLCFPTYYSAEGQPIVLLEAMAFGLSIVATNWRAIQDTLPAGVETCEIRNPQAVAAVLIANLLRASAAEMRRQFTDHFSENCFAHNIRLAVESLKTG